MSMRKLLLGIAASCLLAVSPAIAGQPCDDVKTTAIHACIPEDGIYETTHLACFRSMLAKVNREMSEAYQQRLKITVASAQHALVFVQKLWAQSTEANCKFFGNNTESAGRYECLIGAMIERTQTMKALD